MTIPVLLVALVLAWLVHKTESDTTDFEKWLCWGGLILAVVAALLRDMGRI